MDSQEKLCHFLELSHMYNTFWIIPKVQGLGNPQNRCVHVKIDINSGLHSLGASSALYTSFRHVNKHFKLGTLWAGPNSG